ncbi:RDD family protein [Arthrobacter sp. Soil763]|uniref:RDD family protein n=1 Tax=Arthrobacter sp. Soil763 TaxID=1736402 RepID=UPI0006FA0C8B|nr:transporter [Arthrobacter sp. Soil763]
MSDDVERCPRCHQPVRAGAAFCTTCGAPLSNRAARNGRRPDPAPGTIPVAPAAALHGQGPHHPGPNAQGGGAVLPHKLELVPADAGKRLGAAVLDWTGPVILLAVLFTLGFAGVTRTRSGGTIIYDTSSLVLFGGIGIGVTVAYLVVQAVLEGRSGTTLGNRIVGIRTADADGYAPGGGAVFIRGLLTGAGVLLTVLAAVLVVVFQWFAAAFWILGPLALLGAAWAVVVVVSNTWDANYKLHGWHDTAAKTLVFDVKAGRNPITTGGIQGPYSFAPLDLPPVQQVASPVAGAARLAAPPAPAPAPPATAAAAQQATVAPAPVRQVPGGQAPIEAARSHAVNSRAFSPHPDDDHDRTQVRGDSTAPVTLAVPRIRIDDGREVELDREMLIGRNPAGHPGEEAVQLLPVADPGRSISKTHLHVLAGNGGIWVTDRNSTNGSAVTTPDGIRTALAPGEPTHVRPGSTVHFGDRSFYLGQA